MHLSAGLVAVMLVASPPLPKGPQTDAQKAKVAFVAAQTLYKQGKFTEAIARFEEAYALKPHPIIWYNLGRCNEQLGDVPKALRDYRLYLHQLPDAVDREAVSAAIAGLERKLKDRDVQQLMVFADPADARISVDGKPLGSSPVTIELPSGDHRLLIEKQGLLSVDRSFVMSTSKSMELSFTLTDQPPPTPPMPPPPMVVNEPKASVDAAVTLSAAPSQQYALRSKAWVPIIAVAAGAVLAGIGFAETSSLSHSLDVELSTQMQVTARAQQIVSQGHTMQILAYAGVGLAAAGLVVTAIFWFLPAKSTVSPVVGLSPHGGSAGLVVLLP